MQPETMTNPTAEVPLPDVDRVYGEPWTEPNTQGQASLRALMQTVFLALRANLNLIRTQDTLRLPTMSNSTLRELRAIWRQDLEHRSYTPEQILLLSRFDPIEVEAMHLTPEQVIAAFNDYVRIADIDIGTGRGQIPISYAIYLFRMDYCDQIIDLTSATLQGAYGRLKKESDLKIVAATFGDKQAQLDLQVALGLKYQKQWRAFESVSNAALLQHTQMFGDNSILPIDVSRPSVVEIQFKLLNRELELLMQRLEEELEKLKRMLNLRYLQNRLQLTVNLVTLLESQMSGKEMASSSLLQKARNLLRRAQAQTA